MLAIHEKTGSFNISQASKQLAGHIKKESFIFTWRPSFCFFHLQSEVCDGSLLIQQDSAIPKINPNKIRTRLTDPNYTYTEELVAVTENFGKLELTTPSSISAWKRDFLKVFREYKKRPMTWNRWINGKLCKVCRFFALFFSLPNLIKALCKKPLEKHWSFAYPRVNIYFFRVQNRNSRKRCEKVNSKKTRIMSMTLSLYFYF